VSQDAILLFVLAVLLGAVMLDVLYRKGILWGPDPWIHGDRKPGPNPPPWLYGPQSHPQANGPAVTPERMGKRNGQHKGQKDQKPAPTTARPQKPPPPRPGRRGNAPF
jgi:hypothetical protein